MLALENYRTIHQSFYEIRSLALQFDDIVYRFKKACENDVEPFNQSKLKKSINEPQPKDCFGTYNQPTIKTSETRSLCANPECPYAVPAPCSLPTCPFRQSKTTIECYETKFVDQSSQTDEVPKICSNPDCPYNEANQTLPDICSSPQCPFNANSTEIQDDNNNRINTENNDNRINTENTEDIQRQETQDVANRPINIGRASYRPTLKADENPQNEIIHTSGDRIEEDTRPCRPNSCSQQNGTLECGECSETPPQKKQRKHKKTTNREQMKFSKKPYKWSSKDRYPGYHIGHQDCCRPAFPVPPRQGWLWNIPLPELDNNLRRGWRPGAVRRLIAARIRKLHRIDEEGADLQPGQSNYSLKQRTRQKKPNLRVEKKHGTYLVTMNCAKDPKCKPLEFKITEDKKPEPTGGCEDICCNTTEDEDDDDVSSNGFEFELTSPDCTVQKILPHKKPQKYTAHETQYNPQDFRDSKKKDKKKKGKQQKKNKKNKKKK